MFTVPPAPAAKAVAFVVDAPATLVATAVVDVVEEVDEVDEVDPVVFTVDDVVVRSRALEFGVELDERIAVAKVDFDFSP